MQVRRNTHGGRYNHEVFDDVLPFHGGHHEAAPGLPRQEHERAEGCDHMHKQERQDDALGALYEEQDADEHLEDAEADEERRERHEVDRGVEEPLDDRTCRREACDLERAEPEEYNEEPEARDRHGVAAEEVDELDVDRLYFHMRTV